MLKSMSCGTIKRTEINFMELSPSWQANSSSDIYRIPNILWNPKVHYPIHKSPPLDSGESQIYPIQSSAYPPRIHFNIILQSKARSS
jgi:hypothetical protein